MKDVCGRTKNTKGGGEQRTEKVLLGSKDRKQ